MLDKKYTRLLMSLDSLVGTLVTRKRGVASIKKQMKGIQDKSQFYVHQFPLKA